MAFSQKKIYIKDESFDPIYRSLNKEFYLRSRLFPGILLALGFIILFTQVVYPLVYFKTHDDVSTPVASSVLGVAAGFSEFKFSELSNVSSAEVETKKTPKHFKITIPKLGIKDAVAETDSLSLSPDLALGHYRGSGLPGEVGNAFIYGHSVLPWFYNPKNYKTIFSTIDTLETGDIINVEYNGKILTYKVESKEILPTDKVNPLAEYKPKYLNESTITLMTCWPAGTKAKRLLVRAVMVS